MQICVINGSPKGDQSITFQTALYLEKLYPQHTFSCVFAGSALRKQQKMMPEMLDALREADLLLFCYPVYTFLVPSQLYNFIHELKESDVDLGGKYATQITTSKHFYDTTAHRFVEDNCHDMGVKVIHGLSADMEDLTTPTGRRNAEQFFDYVLYCMENGFCEPQPTRQPAKPLAEYVSSLPNVAKKSGYDTVIVADLQEGDTVLQGMIDDFIAAYPLTTRVINIAEFPFLGGCVGCFHCATHGRCVYRDGFGQFLRERILNADAIVYAFTVSDHAMGQRFKMYDDRQFCNGHRTLTEGAPCAYLINGDYAQEENLRTVVEARAQVAHNFLAGVGTDAGSIATTASKLAYALENEFVQPRNFYGVGGMKIFRDLIWQMRGIMRADHLFYRYNGLYDFPQKKPFKMLGICIAGMLMRNNWFMSRFGDKISEGMMKPYTEAIAQAVPKTKGAEASGKVTSTPSVPVVSSAKGKKQNKKKKK